MMFFDLQSVRNRGRSQHGGHALVLTLLILLLTAAVAFGVLSIGRHARVKEMTHFSAQAGAESGASWIARSLNTVSMNNNAMAQLIVKAGIIEGLPTAMDMYQKDLKATQDLLKQIDIKDLPREWQPIDDNTPIAKSYERLKQYTHHELRIALNTQKYYARQLSENDLAAITHVKPQKDAKQPGAIWQAIYALDEINQTQLENLEVQAQLAVLRGSVLDTTARQTEASALLIPTDSPTVNWQRGSFDDFAPIIAKDHEYAVTMGYYDYASNPNITDLRELTFEQPQKIKVYKNRAGKCLASRIRASQPSPRHHPRARQEQMPEAVKFAMPAIQDMALLDTIGPLLHRLNNKRLINHLHAINASFMAQLWPDEKSPAKPVYDSQWVTDMDKIYQIMDKDPQSIREIAFITVEAKSAVPPTDPKYGNAKNWALIHKATDTPLQVEYFNYDKRLDPRTWEKLGMQELHPRLWREVWTQQIYADRSINVKPLPAQPKNKYPRQPIYRVDDYLLIGINVGKPVKLHSPYNFPSDDAKPAPILYIQNEENKPATDEIRRSVVAQNHVRSLPWSNPTSPTETASPLLSPYDVSVSNSGNFSFWFQGWMGRAVSNDSPNLANAKPTNVLEPLISSKLYDSVLTELKAREAQQAAQQVNEQPQEETEVP
ncbi:MAG: hypothetical protein ACF8OB_09375 [Phycisphaeraceae bacterium JB051]